MGDILGLVMILGLGLAIVVLNRRVPSLTIPLFVALASRVAASLYNVYVGPIPGINADASTFEHYAWEWARDGFPAAVERFTGPDSYFISWVISLFYAGTDRSLILAQSISTVFGMGTVILTWVLARSLWGDRAARKAVWVVALFPTLILYSALTMREAYICFFMLLGLLGVVRWSDGDWKTGILLGVTGFFMATMFHGAMLLSLLAFMAIISISSLRKFYSRLSAGFFPPFAFVCIVLGLVFVGGYVLGVYSVPKLGSIEQIFDIERILYRIGVASRDTASYPDWLVPDSLGELIVLAPLRVVYFLFSPFPWDLREPRHLMGLFDGLLYLGLFALLWKNRSSIWTSHKARTIFLVTLPALLAFALAVGNFGTGIRHRSKFVAIFIILVAPILPRIVLSMRPVTGVSQKTDCNDSGLKPYLPDAGNETESSYHGSSK